MKVDTPDQDEITTTGEVVDELEVLEGKSDPSEEKPEGDEKPDGEGKPEADDDGELVITLEGEEPEPKPDEEAAPWVRQLRKERREDKRRLREYEQQLAELKARATPVETVEAPGQKPTLEGCDFDGEVFAQKLEAWHEKNAKHQAAQAESARKQAADREAWEKKLQNYAAQKTSLKVPDYEDAEEAVLGSLNVTQQGLLLKSKEPAKLVYVLGNRPSKLAELAAITDPIDFVYAVADIQGQVKMQKRTPPPVNDRPPRASTSGVSVADQQLEKLKEEARKSGDYSKYFAAKNARAKG